MCDFNVALAWIAGVSIGGNIVLWFALKKCQRRYADLIAHVFAENMRAALAEGAIVDPSAAKKS